MNRFDEDLRVDRLEPGGVRKRRQLGSMTDQRWNELVTQLKALGLIKSTPKASDLYQTVAY